MLRALPVIANAALADQLAEQVDRIPTLRLQRSSAAYTSLEAVLQAIRLERPDFLFVYVDDVDQLGTFLTALDGLGTRTPVIGLGTHLDAELTLRLMRLGVRDYLTFPIDAAKLAEAVTRVSEYVKTHHVAPPSTAIYSFLPAKPGVGCSTIALAAASVLANDLGARTLLIDSDLHSGPVRFLLNLGTTASFVDALGHAQNLDEDMWAQMIGRHQKLDVLHSGGHMPPTTIPNGSLARVLAVARRLYDVICVDLAAGLRPLSLEILEESQRIFLVTTGELTPLHFAQERIRHLTELGLRDRVSLVLSRDGLKGQLSREQVGEAAGIPVSFTLPNKYQSVQRAVLEGDPVPDQAEMIECIQAFTHFLLPDHSAKAAPPEIGRKFLEFFRIPFTTDSTVGRRLQG